MKVRLTQIDGKLPNIALMKLAYHHRARGDEVYFTKEVARTFDEPGYDRVYASAIFSSSTARVGELKDQFPGAIVGGTYNTASNHTVEEALGIEANECADYSIYPRFDASIGFTQRGCRLKCGFCVVPKKEGKQRTVQTIADIWRGEPHARHLHLLDNDFFGQPREQWEARIDEIRAGGFKVCLNQGINVRMIDDDSARALASIPYCNDRFDTKRLYTAWDNVGDEKIFFRGVETLAKHGVKPSHLFVYMLIGYDRRETWERVLHRFWGMAKLGIRPYPMIYGDRNKRLPSDDPNLSLRTLGDFQTWVVHRAYVKHDFVDFSHNRHLIMDLPGQLDLPLAI